MTSDELDFSWIEGKGRGFELVENLRRAVFVQEQGYSEEAEFDEQDEHCLHLLLFDAETCIPVATARVYELAPGEYHIGRVAVIEPMRGQGVGVVLMNKSIHKARLQGAKCVLVGAQADKTQFYARFGFEPTGEEYLDEGNPHVMMQLDFAGI